LSVEGLYIVIIPTESEVFNMNTNENNNALVIAKAYFEAMANKDIEKLRRWFRTKSLRPLPKVTLKVENHSKILQKDLPG
jgi:hypothetical protein